MNSRQSAAAGQQRRVLSRAQSTDAYEFFNLLTGPQLLADVEELLPEHRERLFPPTETLSMLMAQAALLADQIPRQLSFKHTVPVWIAWQQRGGGTHFAAFLTD